MAEVSASFANISIANASGSVSTKGRIYASLLVLPLYMYILIIGMARFHSFLLLYVWRSSEFCGNNQIPPRSGKRGIRACSSSQPSLLSSTTTVFPQSPGSFRITGSGMQWKAAQGEKRIDVPKSDITELVWTKTTKGCQLAATTDEKTFMFQGNFSLYILLSELRALCVGTEKKIVDSSLLFSEILAFHIS